MLFLLAKQVKIYIRDSDSGSLAIAAREQT